MTGTKMPVIVLDISRTVSRLSNANPTGIDRVELAYINHFLTYTGRVVFLARFRKQSVFLDRNGMQTFLNMMSGEAAWGDLDFIGRLSRNKKAAHVESNLRRLALSWPSLKTGMTKVGVSDGVYLNVGHGKLMPKLWDKLKGFSGKKICMVHDVIPLDFPEYCSEKTRLRFKVEFSAMAANSNYLIWNSQHTSDRANVWLRDLNVDPPLSAVVPLGVDIPNAREHNPTNPPYFVAIGTIEPRKNHALLLDIWEDLYDEYGNDAPKLHIVGGRGWMNDAVFHRLDSAPYMETVVVEHGYLPEQELSDLLANASGLLFPSVAEGFGFPLIDAIARNVPVVCSDIPAFKEFGKNYPIYADPHDKQSWVDAIDRLSTGGGQTEFKKRAKPEINTWEKHFSQLSSILSDLS